MLRTSLVTASAFGMALLGGTAQAAISVGATQILESSSVNGSNNNTSQTYNMTLQEGSNSILIVGYSLEFGSGGSVTLDPSGSATAFAELASAQGTDVGGGGTSNASVFAIDLGTVGALDTAISFAITPGSSIKQMRYTAVQLFGVDVGTDFDNVIVGTAGTTSEANSLTTSLTGLASGSFVFSAASSDKGDNESVTSMTSNHATTGSAQSPSGSNNRSAYGYSTNQSGNQDYTFSVNVGVDTSLAVATVGFKELGGGPEIPEPASLALMGLGGLLMLGRSRRSA